MNILKTEATLLVIFYFILVHSSLSIVHRFLLSPLYFLPSLLFNPILSLSSLSRSCKLQIRNIPPHMQWEVSANRLLTASRVAHYQDSQLGSCSGVQSHLPPYLLLGFCYGVLDDSPSECGDSGSGSRPEEQMELRLVEQK